MVFSAGIFILCSCNSQNKSDIQLLRTSGEAIHLKKAETLRLRIGDEPPSWNWLKTSSDIMILNIAEGLFEYEFHGEDPILKPALVESWQSDSSGRFWTFHIRPNIKWSNGDLFTAADVVHTWQWILDPGNAANCSDQLLNFKNAHKVYEKKLGPDSLGAHAKSSSELVVELEKPFLNLPRLLTQSCLFPAHRKQLGPIPEAITLGPYVISEWSHDRWIWLASNPNYYGTKAKIENLVLYIIPQHTTALDLFFSRKLDALNAVPATQISKLAQKAEHKVVSAPLIYYLIFNLNDEVFKNKLVRKAFAQAIDREAFAKVFHDGRKPLQSLIPKGYDGYQEARGLSFNPENARKLLAAAQVDPQKLKATLVFPYTENEQSIFEFLQNEFKKNLEVRIELQSLEFKTFLEAKRHPTQGLIRGADLIDPVSPVWFLDLFRRSNEFGWTNPIYLKLLNDAEFQTDPRRQIEIANQIQKLMLEEDVVAVPFMQASMHLLVHQNIRDYPINHLHRLIYKQTSINKSLD